MLPHQEMIGAVFTTSDLVQHVGAGRSEVLVAIAAGNDQHVAGVDAAV